MVSSSDSDSPRTTAQQRKKKKRINRKKRLKMLANHDDQKSCSQSVGARISKMAKRPFSPKKMTRTAKNRSGGKKDEAGGTPKFNLGKLKSRFEETSPTENGARKRPKKGFLKVASREKIGEGGSTPRFGLGKSTSKETSPEKNGAGKKSKRGFPKVASILKKKPDTMTEQSKHIAKLQKKLNAAKFRYLNEKLYTESGDKSYAYFQSDRDAFDVYHEGFQEQVAKWPLNPLDKIIAYVRQSPRTAKVVDFGCGEALLAQSVPHEVASFDLVSTNKYVTACNMSRVPLKIASMDIAVFCLSLMGTNMVDYIIEAGRVLKNKGVMLIAEVVSRFDDQLSFVRQVEKLGFCHLSTSNFKMFVVMKFMRDSSKTKIQKSNVCLSLRPCIYKKR